MNFCLCAFLKTHNNSEREKEVRAMLPSTLVTNYWEKFPPAPTTVQGCALPVNTRSLCSSGVFKNSLENAE